METKEKSSEQKIDEQNEEIKEINAHFEKYNNYSLAAIRNQMCDLI